MLDKKIGDPRRLETEQISVPRWQKGPIELELDELPGHSKRLGFAIEDFVRAYDQAELVELSDEDWGRLQNCDSRGQTWTIEDIDEYRGHERDVHGIKDRLPTGREIYAPVVLYRAGHNPFLIGGNTRLMLATALKVRPKVVAVHL